IRSESVGSDSDLEDSDLEDSDDEEIEDLEVDDDLDDDLEDDEDDDIESDENEGDDWDNEDLDMMDLEQEILQDELDETTQPAMDIPMPPPPPPKPSTMITLTSSVRGRAPLGASFDLKQKETEGTKRSRCPKCKNQIAMHKGITRCPICSAILSPKENISDGMRVLIDQARAAIKEGHKGKAKELLSIVLEKNPDNKEAQFFMRKVKAGTSKGVRTAGTQVDLRNVAKISTGVIRLDHLLNGGLSVGAQVMLKGPPFCGKDELFDQIMASALKAGFPVIYVSTNRAMKDVIQGIVKYVPNFKSFNREGKIWMYDLFSKHDTKKVLKEGHRIFNIEIPEDFKRFREDLIFVQEEAVKNYGGGLLIINSLSPLISQTEFNDLHKFLQMLIVRSKGYRFTNLVDVAHGIHDDSVINSVEYLMEGIIEFKEADSRNHLRLRGFGQKVASREWIEYNLTQDGLNLFGSFTQERIV
ncbi:MAG: hypothetical protein KAH57_10150, partial [Thermoplasmata archaeon]|nr:hypothetical protein [Thermoplasmata archaeon]